MEAESAAVSVKELESEQEGSGFEGYGGYSSSWVGASAEAEAAETIAYESYGAYNGGWVSDPTASAEGGAEGAMASGFSSSSYGSADASQWEQSYGSGVDYGGGYEGSWSDGSIDRGASVVADVGMSKGKRGRNEMPIEIVEVKQEELVKNRPREDQAKLTGIAFGPSYQVCAMLTNLFFHSFCLYYLLNMCFSYAKSDWITISICYVVLLVLIVGKRGEK